MGDPAKPKKPRRPRRGQTGSTVLLILDRYLVWVSAGLVAGIWLVADFTGHPLTQGAQAALGSFVAYAALKGQTDRKWRALELEQAEMHGMVDALEKSAPGTPEALAVRRQLVELASRAQGDGGGEP